METLVSPEQTTADVREWQQAVSDLAAEVTSWAQSHGWHVSTTETEIRETASVVYTAPVLEMIAPQGKLFLEPIAHSVFGGGGRVDLYAYPALFRVMLRRKPGETHWTVRTDSGLDWPQPWSRETFFAIAEGLLGAS